MDLIWGVVKDHSRPVFFRHVRFEDMSKENKNEAIRDMTFQVILLLLLPFICSMLFSFVLSVSCGMLINEVIAKIAGSYQSQTKLRQASVLLSGSFILGTSLILSLSYVIVPIYSLFWLFISIR